MLQQEENNHTIHFAFGTSCCVRFINQINKLQGVVLDTQKYTYISLSNNIVIEKH